MAGLATCFLVSCSDTSPHAEESLHIGVLDTAVHLENLRTPDCVTIEQRPTGSAADDHGTDVVNLVLGGAVARCEATRTTSLTVYPVPAVDGRSDADSVAAAMSAALSDGVDLLHVGVVFDEDLPHVSAIVERALDGGVVVIAPVGNRPGLAAGYPARLDGVVGVGATDATGGPSDLSASTAVDVWARGVDVEVPRSEGPVAMVTGTSFAAAQVTASVVRSTTVMPLDQAVSAVLTGTANSGRTG